MKKRKKIKIKILLSTYTFIKLTLEDPSLTFMGDFPFSSLIFSIVE